MMPYGLGLNANGILASVTASHHLTNKLRNLLARHSQWTDPSHLTTMDTMMALDLIHCHNCVLRMVLAVSVSQV